MGLKSGLILGGLCILLQGCSMNREYVVRPHPKDSNKIEMRKSTRPSFFPVTRAALANMGGANPIGIILVAPIALPFDLIFGWFGGEERIDIALKVKITDENHEPLAYLDLKRISGSVTTDADGEIDLSFSKKDRDISAFQIPLDFGSDWKSHLSTTGEAVRPTPEKLTYRFDPKNPAEPITLLDHRGEKIQPTTTIVLKREPLEDKAVKRRIRMAAERVLVEKTALLKEQMKMAKAAATRGERAPDMRPVTLEIKSLRGDYQKRYGKKAFKALVKQNGLEEALEALEASGD